MMYSPFPKGSTPTSESEEGFLKILWFIGMNHLLFKRRNKIHP